MYNTYKLFAYLPLFSWLVTRSSLFVSFWCGLLVTQLGSKSSKLSSSCGALLDLPDNFSVLGVFSLCLLVIIIEDFLEAVSGITG